MNLQTVNCNCTEAIDLGKGRKGVREAGEGKERKGTYFGKGRRNWKSKGRRSWKSKGRVRKINSVV